LCQIGYFLSHHWKKKKVLSPEKIEIKSENNSTGIHKQAG
jgi:hypothetical protein